MVKQHIFYILIVSHTKIIVSSGNLSIISSVGMEIYNNPFNCLLVIAIFPRPVAPAIMNTIGME